MEQDELSRLREEAARILKDVRAGTHPQDIRDAGKALNGKWDQDFPTALLKLVVDDGNTITALRTALSRAEDSLTRAHVENAELREALGPCADASGAWTEIAKDEWGLVTVRWNSESDEDKPELTVGDLRRAARVLASTSPSPILAEIARLREACELARSALDRLMGDSDLDEDESPEMIAMQSIARALASTSSTTLDRKDGE